MRTTQLCRAIWLLKPCVSLSTDGILTKKVKQLIINQLIDILPIKLQESNRNINILQNCPNFLFLPPKIVKFC